MGARDHLILAARIANPWGGGDLPSLSGHDFEAVAGILAKNKVSFLELERRHGEAFAASGLREYAERERADFDRMRGEFERVRLDLAAHDVPTMLFKSAGLFPSFPHLSSNLDVLVPWGRGDAGRERLYHLGYIELLNVEEPVKFLFRRFSGDGMCYTFHLHEQIGWGIPFMTNERVWADAVAAPDDPGILIPCARDAVQVTTAHWFYEDKVLTLENLLLTANALRNLPGGITEAAEHAAERGWREGFYLGLHVFDRAWRGLYGEDGLPPADHDEVERFVRDGGYERSRLLRKTVYPPRYPARVPFLTNKVYWLKKLWRDRHRPIGRKVADVWENGWWTVRSQLHVITQKPLLVTLSGCDGSGKTVQARSLEETFHTCDMRVAVLWSRGASSPVTGAMIRLGKRLFGGDTSPADGNATEAEKLDGRRARLSNPLARWLFSVVYAAELFWPFAVRARWLLARGHAVVCDRYVADAMVDFAMLSGRPVEETPAALRWLRRVSPTPHVAFLLDVDEDEALRRKPEEGGTGHIAESRRAFRALAPAMGLRVIDADLSREEVYEAVTHETLSRFYLRYRTFINWLLLSNPRQLNPRAWRATRVYDRTARP